MKIELPDKLEHLSGVLKIASKSQLSLEWIFPSVAMNVKYIYVYIYTHTSILAKINNTKKEKKIQSKLKWYIYTSILAKINNIKKEKKIQSKLKWYGST